MNAATDGQETLLCRNAELMDSLGGGTDDLEIIAGLAMYVAIAAALTLGVREWASATCCGGPFSR